MKILKRIALILLSFIIWTLFIGYGVTDGFLLKNLQKGNSTASFVNATKDKIGKEFVGNLAMILLENGKVSQEFFHSEDKPVDKNTVFQMASVSKWVTSWGVFALVEKGILDIDNPIETYLTRWHLPKSDFDHDKVTIRKLLSHSSGLIDDLGYEGFAPNEKIQTIEESLTKAADGLYSEGIAKIGFEPGSRYMYSGAGYTILQLIIEEVSGQSFQEYMTQNIFKPLQMNQSTFVWDDKKDKNLATLYNDERKVSPHIRFTALAAASLYTSAADLTKFIKANLTQNNVLSLETLKLMSTSETFINSVPVYGLGPHLYSQRDTKSKIIGHDGNSNRPLINTAARVDLNSGNGIIIIEMGSLNIASKLADEWIFWKAGIADYVVIQRNMSYVITLLISGFVLILFISIYIIRQKNKKAIIKR
jgi:CubicO group peptidase (beta-lactamase class C family)